MLSFALRDRKYGRKRGVDGTVEVGLAVLWPLWQSCGHKEMARVCRGPRCEEPTAPNVGNAEVGRAGGEGGGGMGGAAALDGVGNGATN